MGKGDKKTRRGKIFNNSYGKKRLRKKNKCINKPKVTGSGLFTKILNKKTGEALFVFSDPDIIDSVDPVKYYKESFIARQMYIHGLTNDELSGKTRPTEESKQIFIKSHVLWNVLYARIKSIPIPENLIKLLSSTKKSEQEKLLKGIELTPDLIAALIFEASEKYGYRLSQYKTKIPQKGIDLSKMPYAYQVKDNGEVKKFGNSELSNGQLKQALNHRKVTIGKFLEKGEIWHCLFTNYKSLNGDETWLGQKQPHYHYVSSAFGIDKNKVIVELKSENYNIKNFHIKLKDYGKQPE